MNKIDCIQPRHAYAPDFEEGTGQIYMPTALYTRAAALMAAGIEVSVHDENIRPANITAPNVGISVIGSPYIPETINIQKRVRAAVGSEAQIFLGGRVISGLRPSQFEKLFGMDTTNGNLDTPFIQKLGIDGHAISAPEHTSLIPIYEMISDEDMRLYLSHEFCLYLAQGCKYSCEFCAAHRTEKASQGHGAVREQYRSIEIMEKDLNYLIERAKGLNIHGLSLYLSNLDLFQTPNMIHAFADVVLKLKARYPGFTLALRGLSTVDSFLKTQKEHPQVIQAMVEAGLNDVGFGIDGLTPSVWQAVRKGFNKEDACLGAISDARNHWGITPEVLMVVGHIKADGKIVDTPENLSLAVDFTKAMIEQYGAIPRPHVAKSFVPGNDGWNHLANSKRIQTLMENPAAFQSLDFTALPTLLTHHTQQFCDVVREHYLAMCALPGNTTLPIEPITPTMDAEQIAAVKRKNKGKYDR